MVLRFQCADTAAKSLVRLVSEARFRLLGKVWQLVVLSFMSLFLFLRQVFQRSSIPEHRNLHVARGHGRSSPLNSRRSGGACVGFRWCIQQVVVFARHVQTSAAMWEMYKGRAADDWTGIHKQSSRGLPAWPMSYIGEILTVTGPHD